MTNEEKREIERMNAPIYEELRQAAEVHRHVRICPTAFHYDRLGFNTSLTLGPSLGSIMGQARNPFNRHV